MLSGELIPSYVSMISSAILIILLGIKYHKLSFKEISLILPILAILIIGIAGALIKWRLNTNNDLYLVGKDIWYYLKPVVFIIAGFYVFRYGIKEEDFILLFIRISMLAALIHLFRVVHFLFTAESSQLILDTIRYRTGPGSILVGISLAYLIVRRRNSGNKHEPGINKWLYVVVLSLSLIMSFSRTIFGVFIISILAFSGYFSFKIRKLANLVIAILLIIFTGLMTLKIVKSVSASDSIAYSISTKYLNSVREMALRSNFESESEKNRNWRGFEGFLTWKEIKKGSFWDIAAGNGFGKTVFVGYNGYLGEENVFIPKFHNGYLEIILKTGIIGLILYLAFFFFAFTQADNSEEISESCYMLFSLLPSSLFCTFFITGFYNIAALDAVCLATGYFLMKTLNKAQPAMGISQ